MQFNVAIEGNFWLCLSLWLIQDSNWKGRVLWKWFGGLATILQNWISCNEQKMREAHITRRETSFYLFMIFIEKISNRKLKHSLPIWERRPQDVAGTFTWRLCHSTWLFLFRQYTENICFFSKFSAGGLCDWGILLVISLEFQGNKASTVFYDTAYLKRKNTEWRGRFPRKAPSFLNGSV